MKQAPLTPVVWAEQQVLEPIERDCVTAVALKILDRKCRMPAEEQEAMLALFDMLQHRPGGLFSTEVYRCIEQALEERELLPDTAERIHLFRLEAETKIPKPVMKAFKARLREELFSQPGATAPIH